MDPKLKPYKEKAITLLAKFDSVGIEHISRGANTMAQVASGLKLPNQSSFKAIYVFTALIDSVLYRHGTDGVLLRCVRILEADRVMYEVHDKVCGSHQAGQKMRWLIRRHGHYYPSIMTDCVSKGCQVCLT